MRLFILLGLVLCANIAFAQDTYMLTVSAQGQAALQNEYVPGKIFNLPPDAAKTLYNPKQKKVYIAFQSADGLIIGSNFEFVGIKERAMVHDGQNVIYIDSLYGAVNYVLKDGVFSKYEPLKGYVIFDYDSKKNTALVGRWDNRLTFYDRKVRTVCNFNVLTHLFNNFISHRRDVWQASYVENGNSIKTLTDREEKVFANTLATN